MSQARRRSPWLVRLCARSLSCLALAVAPSHGVAQRPSPASGAAVAGSELTVYLMTMGPGDRVWERFGHNAIGIRDSIHGTDIVYNWGLFDFEQPNFIARFVFGRTLYWMDGFDAAQTAEAYAADNRSVWIQELDLTPAQRSALRDFVEWNRLPENKFYRYDYYRDNCSTRVRDAIDRALGGQLRDAVDARPSGSTYRVHTRRLLDSEPVINAAVMALEGQPVDRPISVWEEMFIPMRLRDRVRDVRVRHPDGRVVPLVKSETALFSARRPPEPQLPPARILYFLAVGMGCAALVVLAGRRAARGGRAARVGLASLAALWCLVAGLFGVAIVVGWTATEHVVIGRNENLFQLSPLQLPLALLLPLLLFRAATHRFTVRLTYLIAALAVAGFVLQILPWFWQVNGEIIALALPVQLAVAWVVRQHATQSVTRPRRSSAANPS